MTALVGSSVGPPEVPVRAVVGGGDHDQGGLAATAPGLVGENAPHIAISHFAQWTKVFGTLLTYLGEVPRQG